MASKDDSKEFIQNPYVQRNAIREPDYFFGRAQETRETLNYLARGQSVSIVGPRRIGKTSLLLHLARSIEKIKSDSAAKQCFIFLNCELNVEAGKADIFEWIWNETRAQGGEFQGLPTVVKTSDEFKQAVADLCSAGFNLTLLLDEFEHLAGNPHLDLGFFAVLRGLSAAYPVSYVTSSVKPLFDLHYSRPENRSSPLFNIFDQQRLGFLLPEEATDLILRPTEKTIFPRSKEPGFSMTEVTTLVDLAGYHPFFLQIAGYHLFEHKLTGKETNSETIQDVHRQYKDDALSHFRYAWDQLTDREQEALSLISSGQTDRINDHQLLDELGHQCLIYDQKIFSPVFGNFVNQKSNRQQEKTREPVVFISYSQQDEAEMQELQTQMKVIHGLISVWSDDQIEAGETRHQKIDEAIAQAEVAVLLITANYLTSEVLNTQLPNLLQRHKRNDLIIIPVIAKPCAWRAVDWLSHMDVRPRKGSVVWRDAGRHADQELADIVGEVAEIMKRTT